MCCDVWFGRRSGRYPKSEWDVIAYFHNFDTIRLWFQSYFKDYDDSGGKVEYNIGTKTINRFIKDWDIVRQNPKLLDYIFPGDDRDKYEKLNNAYKDIVDYFEDYRRDLRRSKERTKGLYKQPSSKPDKFIYIEERYDS